MTAASDLDRVARGEHRAVRARLIEDAKAAPLDPIPRFHLAVLERLLGHTDAARDLARDALSMGSPPAPIRRLLALLELDALRPSEALVHLRLALRLDPAHPVTWVYLALAKGALGDHRGALDAFDRSLGAMVRPLPPLVASRVALQRQSLAADADHRLLGSRCAVCAVTEWITPTDVVTLPTALTLLPTPADTSEALGAPLSLAALTDAIAAAKRIVVLSGAGLSADSGLATRKALWSLHDRDEAVSVTGFAARPTALWDAVRTFVGDALPEPNAAHLVLASLPNLAGVLTQNIDGLHQRAASLVHRAHPVVELHGSFDRALCHDCGLPAGSTWELALQGPTLPHCRSCQGPVRPDVVLFGEMVSQRDLDHATRLVTSADLLLVVGCAMDVAPASELPMLAQRAGCTVIELNRAPSRLGRLLALPHYDGRAADTLAEVDRRLAEREGRAPLDLPSLTVPRTPRAQPTAIVEVPPLGESNPEATVIEWLVREGSYVQRDTPLVVLGLDKVDVEVHAPVDGVLRRILTHRDDTVRVQQRIAEITPTRLALGNGVAKTGPARAPIPTIPWGETEGAKLVERLSTWKHVPWFAPDAGLLERTPEALAWLQEKADAHRAALGRHLPALGVKVFDDVQEAWRAWRRSLTPYRFGEAGWDLALQLAFERVDPHLALASRPSKKEPRWDMASPITGVAGAVWRPLLEAAFRRQCLWPGWRLRLAPRPLVYAIVAEVFGLDEGGRDPWTPLAEIFMRGAWPFALAPDTLGVYVHPPTPPRALVWSVEDTQFFKPPSNRMLLHCLPPLTLEALRP